MKAERGCSKTNLVALICNGKGEDFSLSWSFLPFLGILMKPGVNMNSYSSQKGIEEETLLGTGSERGKFEVILLSLEDSLS